MAICDRLVELPTRFTTNEMSVMRNGGDTIARAKALGCTDYSFVETVISCATGYSLEANRKVPVGIYVRWNAAVKDGTFKRDMSIGECIMAYVSFLGTWADRIASKRAA